MNWVQDSGMKWDDFIMPEKVWSLAVLYIFQTIFSLSLFQISHSPVKEQKSRSFPHYLKQDKNTGFSAENKIHIYRKH